jgi:hypothetical protein
MAKRKGLTRTVPGRAPEAPGTATDGPAAKAERRDQARQERRAPAARLSAIGLPALPAEGSTLHTHQHLDLYVNGKKQVVPAQIGIITSPQVVFSPLHTDDTSGIIHVESPTVRSFTLDEFFYVWGVRLTRTCIGGYCTQGDKTLRVYVDGQLATGESSEMQGGKE